MLKNVLNQTRIFVIMRERKIAVLLIIMMLMAAYAQLEAQVVWDNTGGGVFEAGSGSIIRISGGSCGSGANGQSGTILGLGTDETTRLPETVLWTRSSTEQTVQNGLYFTNLGFEGINKIVKDVNVSGIYDISKISDTANAIYPVAYTGTFTYDGDIDTVVQIIAPSTGSNSSTATPYNILVMTGTAKKIERSNAANNNGVYVWNKLGIESGVTATNEGKLFIEGTAESYISGKLDIVNNGHIYINYGNAANSNPPVSKVRVDGEIALPIPIITGNISLKMAPKARLEVYGALNNADSIGAGAYKNVEFDASATPSTVAYYDNSIIMPTACEGLHPYGRLELAGNTAFNQTLVNNVHIAGQVEDAFYFSATGGGILETGDKRLKFIHKLANAKYANDNSEVAGWVERSPACGAETSVSLMPNKDYVFNNAKTVISFQGSGSVPAAAYFALNVLPNTLPSKRFQDASPTIDRQIQFDYDLVDDNAGIGKLQLGFRYNEIPGLNENERTAVYSRLRLAEGYMQYDTYPAGDKPQPIILKDNAGDVVKSVRNPINVIGGDPTFGGLLSITQSAALPAKGGAGIGLAKTGSAPGARDTVYSTSQFLIHIPSEIVSVQNGRWSNPATWEYGETPLAMDSVIIKHLVYTGLYDAYNTPLFGKPPYPMAEDKLATEGMYAAGLYPAGNQLAKHVTIVPNTTEAGQNSCLIIGNEVRNTVAGPDYTTGSQAMDFAKVLKFASSDINGITILTPVIDFGNTAMFPTGYPSYNLTLNDIIGKDVTDPMIQALSGLYIMERRTDGNGPFIKAANIDNKGTQINNSILEIGN